MVFWRRKKPEEQKPKKLTAEETIAANAPSADAPVNFLHPPGTRVPIIGGVAFSHIAEEPDIKITITTIGDKLDSRTALELVSKALTLKGYEFEGKFLGSNSFTLKTIGSANPPNLGPLSDVLKDLAAQYPTAESLEKYRQAERARIEEAMKRAQKGLGGSGKA